MVVIDLYGSKMTAYCPLFKGFPKQLSAYLYYNDHNDKRQVLQF